MNEPLTKQMSNICNRVRVAAVSTALRTDAFSFAYDDLLWNQADAIELCKLIESIAPRHGFHVGLTGGLLYKDGRRKDVDILLYRIRQWKLEDTDRDSLFFHLREFGIEVVDTAFMYGFVVKATFCGRAVDFLFPESDGEYSPPREEPEP